MIEIKEMRRNRVSTCRGGQRNDVYTSVIVRVQGLESMAVKGERGVTDRDGRRRGQDRNVCGARDEDR
jgi:hypothetical protein